MEECANFNNLASFDYSYTALSPDGSSFVSGYVNYDRQKGSSNSVIGSIMYKDGELLFSDMRLKDKPTYFSVYPAEDEQVAILKYYKKEKSAEFNLREIEF